MAARRPVRRLELPVDDLAMRILARLAASDRRAERRHANRSPQLVQWLLEWERQSGDLRRRGEVLQANRDVAYALGEAWDCCASRGCSRAVRVQSNPEAY